MVSDSEPLPSFTIEQPVSPPLTPTYSFVPISNPYSPVISPVTPIPALNSSITQNSPHLTPLHSPALFSLISPRSSSSLSSSSPAVASPQLATPNTSLSSSGPVLFNSSAFILPDPWGTLTSRGTKNTPTYNLVKSAVVIGRGKEADIKIPAQLKSISNKHCVISIGREVDGEDKHSSPWFAYISDFSVNGTYVDGKLLPKGQKSLLLEGTIISLVYPSFEDDPSCVAFKFKDFLSTLSPSTLSVLESEYNDDDHIGVAKRLQQLQFSTQNVKNTKKPEYFIYVLKVEATCPNLLLLHDTLRWSTQANTQWVDTFISLGGVSAVLDVVAVNNRKSRTFEADVAIDVECLKILDDFVSYSVGLDALVSQPDSLDDVVLTLLNPNHAVRIKTSVIGILLNVCSHSERGYKVIVNALERLQRVKRDRHRFLFLVHTLITEQDHEYKVKCMTLINTIISSPHDLSLRAKHKHEFVHLGLIRIVEVLYQEHNAALDAQLEAFSKHMDEDDMFYRTVNLEDPLSVCKAIVDQIRRYKECSAAFAATLRRILALCNSGPTDADPIFYSNLPKSFELVAKLASTLTEISLTSHDVTASAYSQRIEQLAANLRPLTPIPSELNRPHTPSLPPTTPLPDQPVSDPLSSLVQPPPPPPPPPGAPPPPPPPPGAPPPPPVTPTGGPPPPPMKGKAPLLPTKKQEDMPKVPMRQLFWTKMAPAKIKNTVWDPSSSSPAFLPNSPIMQHRFASIISPPTTNSTANSTTNSITNNSPTSTNSNTSTPTSTGPQTAPSSSSLVYDKVVFNRDELESMFCAKKQKGTSTNSTTANAAKQEEAKEVSLLDMRRSNNIGIVLSRLKLTPEGIRDDLMRMDDKLLSREKVMALLKCVPTSDEEALVKGYTGDAPLAPVEQFLLQMMKIPRVGPRLECMQYKVGFEGNLNEVKDAVDCVALACQALMNDEAFKQLLIIVLKFGNFMNGGSARGGAIGFKINCLLNLSETKSADNKTTLLHYLVKYMRANMPAVLDKCEIMFRCAEPVSRIVWKEVLVQFEQIKTGMTKVEAELVHHPPDSAQEDLFRPIKSFVQTKRPQLDKLGHKLKDVDSVFIDTASESSEYKLRLECNRYYGEEGVAPEDFFSILHDFHTVFMKAQRDNERERVAAAKREAVQAQKKKLESTPEPKTPKIDITHNMFKILDGKRARRSSPLASPGHLQKSLSVPVKLTALKSPTSTGSDKTTPTKDANSHSGKKGQNGSAYTRAPSTPLVSTSAYPTTPSSPLIIDHIKSPKSPPTSPTLSSETQLSPKLFSNLSPKFPNVT